MIWLTWRQFRAQAITAAAALAVFAIVLAATASDLSGMYNSSGLLTCHGDACTGLASTFLQNLSSGGGSFHGITPLGYAAFGFALGVTAGLLARRPVPAMAITLAIFAAVQFITPLWIRPHLFPTSQTITTIAASGASVSLKANPRLVFTAGAVPGQPGAWIISSEGVNAAGQPVTTIPASCEQAAVDALGSHKGTGITLSPGSTALNNCVASHGIRVAESYQPASHYWPLQWSETGMFLALALTLAGYCFWRLNRRRS